MRKNTLIKITIVFLIAILIAISIFEVYATDIKVDLSPKLNVDIMLTSKETTLDLTNFESDLVEKLKNEGVSTNNINFQTVERKQSSISSEDLNVDQIVNSWETVGASTWSATNGQIYSKIPGSGGAPNGQGNWWGTGLFNQNGYNISNLNMSFTMVDGGNLNEGPAFFVNKNADGSLSGYFINVANHNCRGLTYYTCRLWRFDHYTLNSSFSDYSTGNGSLWCWDATHDPQAHSSDGGISPWVVGQKTTPGNDSFTCLAAWNGVMNNANYDINASNGHIVIKMQNQTVVDMTDSTYLKGTVGFWGNNCEQSASMHLTNINITTEETIYRTYDEVLRQPTWRNGAEHVIVNVDNTVDTSFTDTSMIGELLSRTQKDNIHFIQWGTDENKAIIENFIKQNDNKGLFAYNNDYENALIQTAEYIKKILAVQTSSEYMILGEDTTLKVTPEELLTNSADENYPKGKWKINHEYQYYENNIGQLENAGEYTNDLITTLNKVGRYEITYQDQNITPQYLYVHRRPEAKIGVNINQNAVALNSTGSYDLDKQSVNNGISAEEWSYKAIGDTDWTQGKLSQIENGKDYIVRLRVEDYQNTWSNYDVKYITKTDGILPIADFKLVNDKLIVYDNEELEVVDNSYDPAGKEIINRQWTITKDGEEIYNGPQYIKNYLQYGQGKYTISLKVTNASNAESEAYTKNFDVIEDPRIYFYKETNGMVLRVTATNKINKIKFTNITNGEEIILEGKDKCDIAKDYTYNENAIIKVEVTLENSKIFTKYLDITI